MVCLKFNYVNPLLIYSSLWCPQINNFWTFPLQFSDAALGACDPLTFRALQSLVFSQFKEHRNVHQLVRAVTKTVVAECDIIHQDYQL